MTISLLLLACMSGMEHDDSTTGPTGPTGPSRALPSCAPDDGAAWDLEFGLQSDGCDAEQALPSLTIGLWTSTLNAGEVLDADSARYVDAEGVEHTDLDSGGMVHVDENDDSTVTGSYMLMVDGIDLHAPFEALICPREVMCG